MVFGLYNHDRIWANIFIFFMDRERDVAYITLGDTGCSLTVKYVGL